MTYVECPSCGLAFKARRRDRVAISRGAEETAIVVFRRHMPSRRRVLHTCMPPMQPPPGDFAPVPAKPSGPPPSRYGAFALELPENDEPR